MIFCPRSENAFSFCRAAGCIFAQIKPAPTYGDGPPVGRSLPGRFAEDPRVCIVERPRGYAACIVAQKKGPRAEAVRVICLPPRPGLRSLSIETPWSDGQSVSFWGEKLTRNAVFCGNPADFAVSRNILHPNRRSTPLVYYSWYYSNTSKNGLPFYKVGSS